MEPFNPTAIDLPVTQPIDISSLLDHVSQPRTDQVQAEQSRDEAEATIVPAQESSIVRGESVR
jgi:hypothetical protein